MKKILLGVIALMFLWAGSASAVTDGDVFCQWNGAKGINCKTARRGAIKLPSGLRVSGEESNFNSHGYYRLTPTNAVIPPGSTPGDEVWGKVDNQLSVTWTVRVMTTDELNEIASEALSFEMYSVLKWMKNQGYIDPTTAPPALKDAYLARQALGQ